MTFLEGIKIVELGEQITTPFAGKLLADHGADVIKIEAFPRGDSGRSMPPFGEETPGQGRSLLFAHLNANKRSVALHLGTPTGQALLKSLLREADAFLCGLRPDELAAFGLHIEELHRELPHLVITMVTPYGATGPYAKAPGTPFTSFEMSGAGHTNPYFVTTLDHPPLVLPGHPASMTGGLMGAAGCLLALVNGKGRIVDVAETESFFPVVADQMNTYNFSGVVDPRDKRVKGMAPFAFFPVKDGYASLFIIQEAQWQRFVGMMGDPDWTKAEMFKDRRTRSQYKEDLAALMAPWLEEQEGEDLYVRSQASDVPIGPARTMDNVLKDPHLIARETFTKVKHADGGPMTGLRAPDRTSGVLINNRRNPPMLGEHTREILMSWLGLSLQEISALSAAGVV